MDKLKLQNQEEIHRAFQKNEREVWIPNFRVACILAAIFSLAGSSLDALLFPGRVQDFLKLRLLCAALLLFFFGLVKTDVGLRIYRLLGLLLPALPSLFVSIIIYKTTGADSPYYAALNLVLLGAAIILRWTFVDTLLVFVEVLGLYLAACLFHPGPIQHREIFFNNIFFIIVTGVFVVVGSHFYTQLRFREFAFQYQLNKSKQELEASNTKLSEQNLALENANREIKEAEILLVQAEKMSSLGRFSAGLMHDILNPLNYARTGTFTLRKKSRNLTPELRAEFDETLTDIEDGLQRVNHIVSDLRSFTHPGGQIPESVGLADIFKTSLRFVSSELKEKNISLELNLLSDQKIWIGRNQSILVLVNLLENAIDALVEKKFPSGENPGIQISSRTQGDRSLIFIRDNGPGIGADILHRIFDPFFTTKDVGKGTGLGLSICFGIIRGYGGNLTVNSEPGKFCEFTLDLPANEAAAQSLLKNAD